MIVENNIINYTDDADIDMYENIYDEEHEYDDDYEQEFHDNTYYLGICAHDKDINGWLLASTIKPQTLYKFPYNSVVDYLNNYSIITKNQLINPDILHLSFQGIQPFELYTVVKKTFWLKLIQRTWKKICQQRKEMLKPNLIQYLHKRTLGIRQPPIPGLYGMLSYLKDNK